MRDRYMEELLRKLAEVYSDVKRLKSDSVTRAEIEMMEKKMDALSQQVAENTERVHPFTEQLNNQVS